MFPYALNIMTRNVTKPPSNKKLSLEEKRRIREQEMDKTIMRPKTIKDIITISWNGYIKDQILGAQPKHIIVVGKGVERILRDELNALGIGYTTIDQPNGIRTREGIAATHKKYQQVCSKYCL
jgi:hypothetical protein